MECGECLLYEHEPDINFHFCQKMDELDSEDWDALCGPTWDRIVDSCPYFEDHDYPDHEEE